VLAAPQTLAARGVDVVPVERGGDATYHGPGQLVIYPILKLARFREVVPLVSALESAVVCALATFGIAARTRKHRGVYVDDRAICAIGLAVKQMTSLHGLALNVSTDLTYDRLITPCGTPEFGLTSLSRELGRTVGRSEARDALLVALAERFSLIFESDAIAC
jgi:lipoate-protein ligase B